MSVKYFSNYRIEEGISYFLYVGELKNYGLNTYLKEALSRIHNCSYDFIAIVPDLCEQYNYRNLMVINPLAEAYECRYGTSVNCRVSAGDFAACVSESPQVKELIHYILESQSHLFIYMYESLCQLSLDEMDNVTILGPDKEIARQMNNKTLQMTQLKEVVPVVDFKICNGIGELFHTCKPLWDLWEDGIFVTQEYSAAGINSILAHSEKDIETKFQDLDVPYLVTRYVPHISDPTVLAVVASEDEVYIAGVADQRIEGSNRFTGSVFPSSLPGDQLHQLKEYTRKVGCWLAGRGYRGIFGCDYIVTEDGDIFFLEINARKQGTTLEFCCMLEQMLPKGSPMLPELEYYAVTEGRFPENRVEMPESAVPLHWGTYNYKLHATVKTNGYIPQQSQEREAFEKVASGNLKKDYLILEHTGSDFVIAEGAFIARIVALGQDRESVDQGINQGRKTIELTFVPQT